jgi:DNA replication protein DnaC
MTADLRHPGADPRCTICHGLGLTVLRDGERSRAAPCRCVGLCPTCRGTGFVKTGTGFRDPVRPCDCARVAARGRRFDDVHLPARYADATLASFDVKRGAGAAFMIVNKWLKAYQPGQDNRGLVLHGKVGRGKTHLMAAMLRELVFRHGVTARFVEFSHLLADLKMSFERGGTSEILEPLSQVSVLAIDELGKGRNTEFEGTVLDELISRRYNAGATVLCTTNYEPRPPTGLAAPNLADDDANRPLPALVDRVGERVWSRLREMTDMVPVSGDDWREVGRARRGGPPAPVR